MAPHTVVSRENAAEALATRYTRVRRGTEKLCGPLATEDFVVQSMHDVSPTKWHLAHTSWFFEAFVLVEFAPDYRPLNEVYRYLFNSYYNTQGERHCRARRGYLSRPTVDEVFQYRRHVDDAVLELIRQSDSSRLEELAGLVTLGLHHEQQHQELLLTDIKHVFSVNPLRPAYCGPPATGRPPPALEWIRFDQGLYWIGHDGNGFGYDNEGPRHRAFVEDVEVASRLVTNGEYLAFIEAGGYRTAEFWLSEGWAELREHGWTEPFYWEQRAGDWWMYTLSGMRPVDPHEPVCHVNYFEASAYARWARARLPTEQEWEVAAASVPVRGNLMESETYHPVPASASAGTGLKQVFGDVWEWTRSSYAPYPGYEPPPGALGEYNAKFMCNQYVLRGGSCATPQSHIRISYRNFFPPDASWQFTGIRLARDV